MAFFPLKAMEYKPLEEGLMDNKYDAIVIGGGISGLGVGGLLSKAGKKVLIIS